ncbi:MAG: ankyrin repeat domain-containing protein [Leptospira sp.]|nr:ankyrin repeat domain-containing protein [Leptospira sp.]
MLKNLNPEARRELNNPNFIERNIAQDKYGCTPLFWAIKLSNPTLVTYLLDFGFSPLDQNRDGAIAISALLEKKNEEIFEKCLQWFASYFMDSRVLFPRDQKGSTFFHRLFEHEEWDWITQLLPHLEESSLEVFDSEDFSPLHWAVRLGSVEITKKLLEFNPRLYKLPNTHGLTPVHTACEYNRLEILQELLHLEKEDFLDTLNQTDSVGNTTLHLAVESDAVEIIPFLLNNGISILAMNNSREAVFEIANREKYHHCLKILKKYLLQHMKDIFVYGNSNPLEFESKLKFIQSRKILSYDELYQISPDIVFPTKV